VEFIDVNENAAAKLQYRIDLIPTQVFYDASGTERFRHVGFISKEDILAKWRELGVDLNVSAESPTTAPSIAPPVKSGAT